MSYACGANHHMIINPVGNGWFIVGLFDKSLAFSGDLPLWFVQAFDQIEAKYGLLAMPPFPYRQLQCANGDAVTTDVIVRLTNSTPVADSKVDKNNTSIDDIGLSTRTSNQLIRNGIRTIKDVETRSAYELMDFQNFGTEALRDLVTQLKPFGVEIDGADDFLGKELGALDIPITELGLSFRPLNCLKKYGIRTMGDLVQYSVDDLHKIKNFGYKCEDEVVDKLAEFGLSLRTPTEPDSNER